MSKLCQLLLLILPCREAIPCHRQAVTNCCSYSSHDPRYIVLNSLCSQGTCPYFGSRFAHHDVAGTGPTAAAISKNSTLKEEVTATLLQVLRLHPRASTPVPQGIPNFDQGSQQSQDISVITEGAAYSQSIAELTDWLGSAKIALQVRLPQHMSSVFSA